MKNKILTISYVLVFFTSILLSSCNDYLGVLPKGAKIPTNLADYEAFMRNEYNNQRVDVTQAIILLNDRYLTSSDLSYYPLWKANYMWDESANRVALNNSDESCYYVSYSAISTWNLIIENAPGATECTEVERNTLIAQAKVLRAMSYFNLTNYYADAYDESTASRKLSVPLISSAVINAPYKQVTIQEIYDDMLKNVEDALVNLPDVSATVLHPNKGTAYAFLARCYLQMGKYTSALANAELALQVNSTLFDWTAYYANNKAQIENPNSYVKTVSPMGYNYVENYNYQHGERSYAASERNMPVSRAASFEPGDARFASRWKLRTVGADTYYTSTLTGFFNYGGLTTTEVYLIKAECLARTGKVQEAMDILNAVRIKRILPTVYQPLVPTDAVTALKYIIKTKANELIMTIMPFADTRRRNKEANLARTFTKVADGTTYSLSPTSHLWTMPFPKGATDNHGNGSIIQNVDK